MDAEDLPARFELALKALSISRGRLASELRVDKSVVSRWLSGTNAPSNHNLEKITHAVAQRRPGFSMLDWDRPMTDFIASLGLDSGAKTAAHRPEFRLTEIIPPDVMEEAVATTKFRGAAYEGFWQSTRLAIDPVGFYMHDQIMIWRSEQGLLRSRMGVYDMRFEGWLLPMQSQLFGIACDPSTGVFLFSILNAVFRNRATTLDGLTLTLQRTQGGTPVAAASIMERQEDLSGDWERDEARFRVLTQRNPVASPDSVPKIIRDHLFKDVGPTPFAAGGPAMLTMAFAASLSQGFGTGPAVNDSAPPSEPPAPDQTQPAPPFGLRLVSP